MTKAGLSQNKIGTPTWFLAELTYRCPLQCPYCSNPTEYAHHKDELSTEEWLKVIREARDLGCVQLGFSGGEPLVRQDLETLVEEAHKLGYYTNLITSTIGMDLDRLAKLKALGLDHIQISFQAAQQELNDIIAGTRSFEHKKLIATEMKKMGFPLVFNMVIHRHNIDTMEEILDFAISLGADYIELANTQYYGFALENKNQLMPSKAQLEKAEQICKRYQDNPNIKTKIYFVIPDYYENRPKPCMNGWGTTFVCVTPDGLVLPCQSARVIPNIVFPNAADSNIKDIWYDSEVFNKFRGYDWMKEPCKTCPERTKDFGGCHCQAYLLTGDPANTDPVCDLSPNHQIILDSIDEASQIKADPKQLVYRNPKNSKKISTPISIKGNKNLDG